MTTAIKTDASDRIDDFIDFSRNAFGCDRYDGRQGATAEEVAAVVNSCRYRLPELYVDYLRAFGRDSGGLELAPGSGGSVDDIVWYLESPGETLERAGHYFVIALENVYWGTAFDFSHFPGVDQPRIVAFYDFRVHCLLSTSIHNYLYANCYIGAMLSAGRNSVCNFELMDDRAANETIGVVTELGFSGYWFNDSCLSCFDGEGVLLAAINQDGRTALLLSGNDRERVEVAKSRLLSRLPLREVRR